ncbi:MAG: insulinase family protein [Desulfobacterales bacterium]
MIAKWIKYWPLKSAILTVAICFILSIPEINPKASEAQSFLLNSQPNPAATTTPSPKPAATQAPWPHEKSDLHPDPAVVFGRLANGLRYALLVNHEPKDRVSLHLNIQAGSMHETDEQQGLAHFLEHMLFNGSTHFKPGELVKFFKSIGMQWGADANAHTGFYETVYDVLLPKGDREHLEKGLTVLSDYAQGAFLLESEIIRERRVVLAEKRNRDSASFRTFESTLKFEFPEARLSRRLPIGRSEVLESADQRRLKAYYDAWYRPEQIVLIMVGQFDPNLAQALITRKFEALTPRTPPPPEFDFGNIRHKGLKTFYHFEKETGHTETNIEVVTKIDPRPDSGAFRQEKLIRALANQMVQNRLDALAQKPETPFTSASIASDIFLHRIQYGSISAESSPDNWEKALALIEQTLRQALKYGFTQSELERVKKDVRAELATAVKKADTRSSGSLARQLIRSINSNKVFLSPRQEQSLFAPLIKRMTLYEVHDAFNKIWSSAHRLVLVTGDANLEGSQESPEALIRKAYQKSVQVAVSAPIEKGMVVFPYLTEPQTRGKIVRQEKIADLGITQVDFENGVRLNLKKTDFKANEIIVDLSFGSGRSSEPQNRSGLGILSEAVINESGLGQLERDEIERALAGKNTVVGFGVGEDRFFFRGSTVPQEVALLFQLLYAHLVDPGLRQSAYRRSMQRFKQEYLALSSSIEGALRLHGSRFLAGGDTRFGMPPYATFKQLTREDIRSWIELPLKHTDFEVSVVGDLDVPKTIEMVSKYLGSLPKRLSGPALIRNKKPQFPVQKVLNVDVETKIPKGLVILALPTDDMWDIRKTRRISILAQILSERLRQTIREKLGASYSPFAYNRPSRAYKGYGVLRAIVFVDPREIDPVLKEIKTIVSDLAQKGVGQDEFELALKPALTSIKDLRRTNGYWLNSVLVGSKKNPIQLQWSRSLKDDYSAMTVAEVTALAKAYLNLEKGATIIIQPKKSPAS